MPAMDGQCHEPMSVLMCVYGDPSSLQSRLYCVVMVLLVLVINFLFF